MMTMATSAELRRRVQVLRTCGRDERGAAMMAAMLFMVLLTGMSMVLLSIILAQVGPAYVAQKRTKTVYAAQAGLQTTLGLFRSIPAAADATGAVFGNKTKLPCSFSGLVDGVSTVGYDVVITYFDADPTGKDETTDAAWWAAHQISCTSARDSTSPQPPYAYIVSTGIGESAEGHADSEGNRRVAGVYKFRISNINIPGGAIYDLARTNCLEAQANALGALGAGSQIKFVAASTCTNPDSQQWIYDTTYQIKLASSTLGGATGLCISGPNGTGQTWVAGYTDHSQDTSTGGYTDHTKDVWVPEAIDHSRDTIKYGKVNHSRDTIIAAHWDHSQDTWVPLVTDHSKDVAVPGRFETTTTGVLTGSATLQPCAAPTAPDAERFNQLWSWNGSMSWVGQKKVIADGPSTRCLSKDASSFLTVVDPCSAKFAPEPSVGAGAASFATKQIVNYKEFGRCLDVTNENITYAYMISYPCKQDPSGSTTGTYIKWNHKWSYTEPTSTTVSTKITVVNGGTSGVNGQTYCLEAPLQTATVLQVVFKGCAASGDAAARQTWTRTTDTNDYAGSYLFVDTFGRCLATDTTPTLHDGAWSKIRVEPCDGGLDQKWNAPAVSNDASFGSFKEMDAH